MDRRDRDICWDPEGRIKLPLARAPNEPGPSRCLSNNETFSVSSATLLLGYTRTGSSRTMSGIIAGTERVFVCVRVRVCVCVCVCVCVRVRVHSARDEPQREEGGRAGATGRGGRPGEALPLLSGHLVDLKLLGRDAGHEGRVDRARAAVAAVVCTWRAPAPGEAAARRLLHIPDWPRVRAPSRAGGGHCGCNLGSWPR